MSKRYRPDQNHVYRTAPRAKRVRRDPTIALAAALQSGDKGSCLVAITPETRNLIWLLLDMTARVQLSRTCRGLHREMKASAWRRALARIGVKNLSSRWFVAGIDKVVDECATLATAARVTLKYHWDPYDLVFPECSVQIAWKESGLPDAYAHSHRLPFGHRYQTVYRSFRIYVCGTNDVRMRGGANAAWAVFRDWLRAWLDMAQLCRATASMTED